MSNYTFTFKKGDIIAEFKTTDKQAVERQFPLWVASADEAAKKIKQLEEKMYSLARELQFEEAAKIRDEIKLIQARAFVD